MSSRAVPAAIPTGIKPTARRCARRFAVRFEYASRAIPAAAHTPYTAKANAIKGCRPPSSTGSRGPAGVLLLRHVHPRGPRPRRRVERATIGASRGRSRDRTTFEMSWPTVLAVGGGRSMSSAGHAAASPRALARRSMRLGTSLTSNGVLATQIPPRDWLTTTVRFEACQATRRRRSSSRRSSISNRDQVHPMD